MLNKILALAGCLILLVVVLQFVHAADSSASSVASAPVPAPIQAVMTPYLQIHDALAKDSLDGVSAAASNISKAAQNDKLFPNALSREAAILAQAQDLDTARDAFKPLSETLIKVLADNKVSPDAYSEAYCPMQRAHWLQTGGTGVSNPFGSYMATCGSIVSGKAPSTSSFCPMGGGCCN